MRWTFPRAPGLARGINDAGVAHYIASGDTALFRECVQNSLDAIATPESNVHMQIVVVDLPTSQIDGEGLSEALRRCVKSKYNDNDGREQFQRALELLAKPIIPTLQITDSETKGASDDPGHDDEVTPWQGLTTSVGHSAHKGGSTLGSFGLGKHAAFAVTPLRTVLYSTCYQDDPPKRRFIGRSILVTHYDEEGNQLSPDGFLGDGTAHLAAGDIPSRFHMPSRGTRVLIPGWESGGDTDAWKDRALRVIAANFFWAILNNHLAVVIGDDNSLYLEKDSLLAGGDARHLLEDVSSQRGVMVKETNKTLRYIDVSTRDPAAKKHFPGVGEVELRIGVGIEGSGHRDIALVREPGLFITDVAKLLGDLNPAIPRFWKDFTAVVVVKPRDGEWVLRDCESPAHNAIDVGEIRATRKRNTRKEARLALRKVRNWLRQEIEKYVNPGLDSIDRWDDQRLIDLGLYIESDEDGNTGGQEGGDKRGRSLQLGDVRVNRHVPRRPGLGFDTKPVETQMDDPEGEEQPGQEHLPENEGGPNTPNPNPDPPPNTPAPRRTTIKKTTRVDLRAVLAPVAGEDGQRATHAFRVALAVPEETRNRGMWVRVAAIREDTTWAPVKMISVDAGSSSLDIVDPAGGVFAIPEAVTSSKSRLSLTIKTSEPVGDTAFDIVPLPKPPK